MSAPAVPLPAKGREGPRLDVALLSVATVLVVIGLVMTLSATAYLGARSGNPFALFGRQLAWGAVGLAVLAGASRLDYRRLRGLPYLLLPAVWALLAMTLHPTAGSRAYGASRWIALGPLSFQPSEAAKLVMLLFGADVLSRKADRLQDWRHVVLPHLAAAGITCLLVLMQPDFGTMLIIAGSAWLVALLAGASLRALGAVGACALAAGIPAMLLEGYRRERLLGFLGGDPLGARWQSIQGLVALGSGNLFGLGLGSGRQKWGYLPNAHTDFIFAILGEETGLLGTLTVLALYAALCVLGVRAARRAPDAFGYLVASGVTGWMALQVLVNMGAVTGLLPITGVPLPLISFGGSSLVFSLAGLGLVASVARQGEAARRGGRRRGARSR